MNPLATQRELLNLLRTFEQAIDTAESTADSALLLDKTVVAADALDAVEELLNQVFNGTAPLDERVGAAEASKEKGKDLIAA